MVALFQTQLDTPSATEDADVDVGVARRLSRRRNNDNAEEEDVPLETFPGTSTMTKELRRLRMVSFEFPMAIICAQL